MGETRVDLLHLLKDLRDAYPGSPSETILVEILANALDSGADTIQVTVAPTIGSLTIVDNGCGMSRRDVARFHDIAASSKTRGAGIGFAGVGVKLGLLEASEVLTETRCNGRPVATSWRLVSRRRAPWQWVQPTGLVGGRGTAVRLQVPDGLSPLLDESFVEGVLQKGFAPLLDPRFEPILSRHYPRGAKLMVNERVLARRSWSGRGETADIAIKLARQRMFAGVGWLLRSDHALPEDEQGVAVSTFGKVILRGWEWLGLRPAAPDTISGLIQVPDLAACLQTNKAGFIREGPLGATYLRYHKAIQQAVARQLSEWGADRGGCDLPGPRTVRPFERDLEKVIGSLARDFPLLTALGNKRSGGQYRLLEGSAAPPANLAAETAPMRAQAEPAPSLPPPEEPAPTATEYSPPPAVVEEPSSRRRQRRGRLQVRIQFEDLPESAELGRLASAVLWINQAHPAYRRALASRSTGYHVALACCLALAPLAAPKEERAFISTFLARWGEGAG